MNQKRAISGAFSMSLGGAQCRGRPSQDGPGGCKSRYLHRSSPFHKGYIQSLPKGLAIVYRPPSTRGHPLAFVSNHIRRGATSPGSFPYLGMRYVPFQCSHCRFYKRLAAIGY